MRLLIVSKSYPPVQSAQALQMRRVVEAIASAHVDVQLIAGVPVSLLDSVKNTARQAGIAIEYVPFNDKKEPRGILSLAASRLTNDLNSINVRSRWVSEAYQRALCLSEESRPDILMTVFTPIDSHMVGLNLRRALTVPWIVSFSDPWPPCLRPEAYAPRRVPLIPFFQLRLLKRMLRSCRGVHMPSKYAFPLFEEGIKSSISAKSWVIPHVAPAAVNPPHSQTNGLQYLAHVGHITHHRLCPGLLEAIKICAESMPGTFGGLRCAGRVCEQFRSAARALGVEDSIQFLGHVPEKESIQIAASSQALILIEAQMPQSPFLPSKLADYAATGRPIIAITPKISAVRDYLNRFGGGVAVGHDRDEIVHAINSILQTNRNAEWLNTNLLYSQFEGAKVGEEYVQMFKQLTSQNQSPVGNKHPYSM